MLTHMGLCHRYHVTLHDSEKLEMLQDRLEDLPPPVVVSRCRHSVSFLLGHLQHSHIAPCSGCSYMPCILTYL